ncbi:Uncharacterized protein LSUE1_G005665 [Lachnellula suecica]|uniref:HNH domain-containing protein n=1 Tax=Lachnellula suecica TaxID=602035 RepID=A0A8T9C8M9_9HELO|nr:Uncharacterized protein LSUE1_G005665 [Lachnellula suecica]
MQNEEDNETSNFQLFRDCLSTPLIEKSSVTPPKKARKVRAGRKTAIKPVYTTPEEPNDAAELGEFIDVSIVVSNGLLSKYLATEIFTNLPAELRTLTYSTWLNTPSLQARYSTPISSITASNIINTLPLSITDTLTTYEILSPTKTTFEFLLPILTSYLETLTTAPPPVSELRNQATECEICGRSWIPLTFHHLIPREVHAKVLKRGWHTEDKLQSVAWICRACHNLVHRIASNEELAKELYTVDRLLEREDVRKFAEWVGRVRWKAA